VSRPPLKPRDFASMVPKAVREETERSVGESEAAKAGFRKKQRESSRMRQLDGDTGADLVQHDEMMAAGRRAAARKRQQQDIAEAQARKRKPPRKRGPVGGSSRRRKKADAWSERGEKLHRRMQKHLDHYQGRLRQLGQDDASPVGVPPLVWGTVQAIMADPTGHTARIKLASLPSAPARKIIRAALRPDPYQARREREGRELRKSEKSQLGGPRRWWQSPGVRRWTHPAAIRTAALGIALWHMRKRSARRGFGSVVRGIPRGMLCAMAADGLTGVRPSISALFGNMDEVPGAVRALAEAGLLQIQQPPGAKVKSCDRGPSGYAFNTYWFYAQGSAEGDESDEETEVGVLRETSLRVELGLERAPPAQAA